MTEKTEQGGANGPGWAERMHALLTEEVEAMVQALKDSRPGADGGDAALDRRARTITSIARSVKAVAAVMEPTRPRARTDAGDGMNEKDIDDIDPAELARIRAELESRLDHVAGLREQKRLAGWAGSGANAVGAPAADEAAPAPDSA